MKRRTRMPNVKTADRAGDMQPDAAKTCREPVMFNVRDIMRIFKCGRDKAYAIMQTEGFPSFRIDGTYYVERDNLEKWIRSCKNKIISTT